MLAVIKGGAVDRVPFVQYDGIVLNDEAWRLVGRGNLGLLRWSAVHGIVHPNCRYAHEEFWRGQRRGLRTTLHTPAGELWQERLYESGYGSSAITKHFVCDARDYEVLLAYLCDCQVVPRLDIWQRDRTQLGEDGLPLVATPRTPYQQLWIEWTGLGNLTFHMADAPDRVMSCLAEMDRLMRRVFDVAEQAPLDLIDFPDNITAPVLGPARFEQYCMPYYRELSERLAPKGVAVFVHMDGDLRPLHQAVATCGITGLDSFSPAPDNDTSVAEAVALWPNMRLLVNFPSSCHLLPADQVYEVAMQLLAEGGHTGHLQIQVSENVPGSAWRTSYPAIARAIHDFGPPSPS
jgi:hypothetical protein